MHCQDAKGPAGTWCTWPARWTRGSRSPGIDDVSFQIRCYCPWYAAERLLTTAGVIWSLGLPALLAAACRHATFVYRAVPIHSTLPHITLAAPKPFCITFGLVVLSQVVAQSRIIRTAVHLHLSASCASSLPHLAVTCLKTCRWCPASC